jgi:hypothetical protein
MKNDQAPNPQTEMSGFIGPSKFQKTGLVVSKHRVIFIVLAILIVSICVGAGFVFLQNSSKALVDAPAAPIAIAAPAGVLYFAAALEKEGEAVLNKGIKQVHSLALGDSTETQITSLFPHSGMTVSLDEQYSFAYMVINLPFPLAEVDADATYLVSDDLRTEQVEMNVYNTSPGVFEREIEGSLAASAIAYMRQPALPEGEVGGFFQDITSWETVILEPSRSKETIIEDAISPAWSADGHLLYVLKTDGIYQYPVQSHEGKTTPTRINPEEVVVFDSSDRLAFDVTTNMLVVTEQNRTIRSYKLSADGETATVAGVLISPTENIRYRTPVLSPDGSMVAVLAEETLYPAPDTIPMTFAAFAAQWKVDNVGMLLQNESDLEAEYQQYTEYFTLYPVSFLAAVQIYAANDLTEISSIKLTNYDVSSIMLDEWLAESVPVFNVSE